jgi:hypothetical protein
LFFFLLLLILCGKSPWSKVPPAVQHNNNDKNPPLPPALWKLALKELLVDVARLLSASCWTGDFTYSGSTTFCCFFPFSCVC